SLAKLNINSGTTDCNSVELEIDGTINPSQIDTSGSESEWVVCYLNDTCLNSNGLAEGNGGYGEVTTCMDVKPSWNAQINNYLDDTYTFGRICVDTCGNNVCSTDFREEPTNCKDCCNEYGTGVPEGTFFTCFSHCDAPVECDQQILGTELTDGVCGIKNDFCSYIIDYTELDDVMMGPSDDIINVTCSGVSPNLNCEVWMNYTDVSTITFDLDESMWNSLQNIPEDFKYLKNVTIMKDDVIIANKGTEILPDAEITIDSGLGESVRPYGPYTTTYTVKQNNRRAATVDLTIHTMYPSDLEVKMFGDFGCVYREGTGLICNTPPAFFDLRVFSISQDGPNSDNDYISQATCSIGTVTKTVDFTQNDYLVESLQSYYADSAFSFDPITFGVGRHVLTCKSNVAYFYDSSDSMYVSIFGKITDVDVSTPTEVVPGSDYSLYVSKVNDELGQVVPFYTYSWELVQDEISVPFGQTDIVNIPHTFKEGDAEFVLSVKEDYYESFETRYPVTIRIPKQISTSVSPGIIYVPLKGSSGLSPKLLLSNNGPTVNVTITHATPDELSLDLALTTVEVEGFSTKRVLVDIQVPQVSSDKDYVITFKASVSGKLQDQVDLRLVQTQRPVYEFDIYPTYKEIDLVYDSVSYNITLSNVGNQDDSYTLASDLSLSEFEFKLNAGDSKEIQAVSKRAGEYSICVRSIMLLSREPRCVTLDFIKREVIPTVVGFDMDLTIDPNAGGSIILNFTPGDFSGTYVIDFDTNLTMTKYERSFEKLKSTAISIPFTVQKSGVYSVIATAYPKEYPDKSSTTEFSVEVKLPTPFEVDALLEALEGKEITDASILQQMELARRLVEEGNFEEARDILNELANTIQRLETISSYKKSAGLMNPSRTYTFAVAGAILIAVGLVLYLK
ncbi:MAG: hypothetical protein GOU98_03915, partial [Candidatus Altiarchaeota archaeon]|nr:hypothetical protein [Candidatus Altiarchaeota archaeon]